MRKPAKHLLPWILVLVPACAPPVQDEPPPAGQPPAAPADRNTPFGLLSPAKADAEHRDDYLINRPQYVLSYNAKKRTPNWVSWQLRKEDIGNAPRQPFEPDPLLPRGVITKVTSEDYDNSGFDRGHMCPAKDRSRSKEDTAATFYMTNIVPQSPDSNQKGWERLESYCRDLAKQEHVLAIACGPYGVGGTGRKGKKDEIGKHRVITVPAELWKVIVVLPHEGATPTKRTRVIAILMPNDQTVGFDWTKYRTTARAVQKKTGLKFFANLPEDLAEALLDHRDEVQVRVSVPHHDGKKKDGRE